MIGLEFGCGETPRKPHFLGVDVRELPTVKYVCNAWEIDQYVDPNTVDEIFSRHFFEHLSYEQADWTIESWKKVLKPNGIVDMIIPDMAFHMRQWLNPNRKTTMNKNGMTDEEWAITGFWGQQRGESYDIWDMHKSGYDFALLQDFALAHEFKNVVRVKDAVKNLHVTFQK